MSIDEEDIERRVDAVIRELEDFCALASDPTTAPLIDGQRIAFGQMQTRVQLLLSFLMGRQAPNSKW
jgi:hypothetical protein